MEKVFQKLKSVLFSLRMFSAIYVFIENIMFVKHIEYRFNMKAENFFD